MKSTCSGTRILDSISLSLFCPFVFFSSRPWVRLHVSFGYGLIPMCLATHVLGHVQKCTCPGYLHCLGSFSGFPYMSLINGSTRLADSIKSYTSTEKVRFVKSSKRWRGWSFRIKSHFDYNSDNNQGTYSQWRKNCLPRTRKKKKTTGIRW